MGREASGDVEGARLLFADSTEQLQRARSGLPPGSKLAGLVDATLRMCDAGMDTSGFGDNVTFGNVSRYSVEEEVDLTLERLIMELETTLGEVMAAKKGGGGFADVLSFCTALVPAVSALTPATLCEMGCGRNANSIPDMHGRKFKTCCRACGRCKGNGNHDKSCIGGSAKVTEALVPASTELAIIPDAVELYAGKTGDGRAGTDEETSKPGAKTTGGGDQGLPVQIALRTLGLHDEWPTDLTMREIRRRYMREALASHPDKGTKDEKDERTSRFQAVSEAYSIVEVNMAVLERVRGGCSSSPTERESSVEAPRPKTSDVKPKDGVDEPLAICAGTLALGSSPHEAPHSESVTADGSGLIETMAVWFKGFQ